MKRDFLKECNNQGVPLEDFKLAFCNFCLQPECTRSSHGSSKFDQRTRTWKERLFTEVDTLDPTDPRYQGIAGQEFIVIEPKGSSGVSPSWEDPRDLPKKVQVSVPSGFVAESKDPKVDEPSPSKDSNAEVPGRSILLNTPNQESFFLQGGSERVRVSPVKRDPWASPTPLSSGDVVVSKGATVKFGVVKEK
jgi:hypothetical protein